MTTVARIPSDETGTTPANQETLVTQAFHKTLGRLFKAPENFLGAQDLERARVARRSFMGKALAMGAGSALAGAAIAADSAGEQAILALPEHSKTLGKPVARSVTACRPNGKAICSAAKAPA